MIQDKDQKLYLRKTREDSFLIPHEINSAFRSEKKTENKLSGRLSNTSACLWFEYSISVWAQRQKNNQTPKLREQEETNEGIGIVYYHDLSN